jgi:hypothetical protein
MWFGGSVFQLYYAINTTLYLVFPSPVPSFLSLSFIIIIITYLSVNASIGNNTSNLIITYNYLWFLGMIITYLSIGGFFFILIF